MPWKSLARGVYDKVVIAKNMETMDAFSSCVIPMKAEKAYTGECINVMTQGLWAEDGSLHQGLTVQKCVHRAEER